jgi:hypothetical protein
MCCKYVVTNDGLVITIEGVIYVDAFPLVANVANARAKDAPLSANIRNPHEFALDVSVGISIVINKRTSKTHHNHTLARKRSMKK